MKIHADKIQKEPPHALRVQDVRQILTAVPPAWIDGLREVHLTNSLELSAWAFFSRYDNSLTIYSRGCTAEEALVAVLTELAACAIGINTRQRHRYSAAEAHRMGHLIQPLVEKILLTIARRQRPLGYCPVGPVPAVSNVSATMASILASRRTGGSSAIILPALDVPQPPG